MSGKQQTRHERFGAAWREVRAETDAKIAKRVGALVAKLEALRREDLAELIGRLKKARGVIGRSWKATLAQRNWADFVVRDAEAVGNDQ